MVAFSKFKGQNHDDVDCSQLGFTGHPITGDLHSLENLLFQSDARYIVIVEKVHSLTGFIVEFQYLHFVHYGI